MRKANAWAVIAAVGFLSAGCNSTRYSMDAGSSMTKAADKMMPASTNGPQTDVGDGMANKVVRGVINTFTGWFEWPMQTYKGYVRGVSFIKNDAGSKTVGTLMGLIFAGPGHAIGRTGSGLHDLFGFWLPNPPDNKGVGSPLDARYSWEMGEAYSIFKPSLSEGVKPWGRKIVRGVVNGVAGIAELPGQIIKGAHQGKVGTGIVKGFWFTLGRYHSGWCEAFSFLFPNPEDQMGYGFEEEYPWDACTK